MSRRWNSNEDVTLYNLVALQQKPWKDILKYFPGKSEREIRARYFHRYTNKLQKLWTPEEDRKLIEHYHKWGFQKWSHVARQLTRSVRECRDRWINDIGPTMSDGVTLSRLWTDEEDNQVLHLFRTLGQKWSTMSLQMKNRTPEEIRCRWESRLKRRYKYRQSIQKPSFGIRVSVLRKGEKEWQQVPGENGKCAQAPDHLTIPVKEEPSEENVMNNNGPVKNVLRSVQTPLGNRNQENSHGYQSDHAVKALANELMDISTVAMPSDELDEISKMDWDISNVLGLTPDKSHTSRGCFEDKENNPPPITDTASSRLSGLIKFEKKVTGLETPVVSPKPSIGRRKRSRKQMTSTPYPNACLSSPSPPAADPLTSQNSDPFGEPSDKFQNSDSDDREAFIKRFKLEVERDLTELQLKGTSQDASFSNEFFSEEEIQKESENGAKDSKLYNLSNLVSPIKPSAGIDLSSNAVLSLASEVDNSLRSSSPRPSIEAPHFEPPLRYRAFRFPRRPSDAPPPFSGSSNNSGGSGGGAAVATAVSSSRSEPSARSKSGESEDQAILEKYNPVRFAFRRVMQIGSDRSWRHVALGSSRVQTVMTNLAQSFLRYQQHSV